MGVASHNLTQHGTQACGEGEWAWHATGVGEGGGQGGTPVKKGGFSCFPNDRIQWTVFSLRPQRSESS